ncbi:hypothetical protein KMW35_20170 [Parabacteroides distasonis]|nr:hypothetical protein [Parabacteroides distasonis]
MKTILRGISMRLSLIAMVLCLCAAWPGHGLAWVWSGRRIRQKGSTVLRSSVS